MNRMSIDRVFIVGAFDRFNYGDILFPIIIEKLLRQANRNIDIKLYSTLGNDLSKYDGVISESAQKMESELNNLENTLIIFSGGEILGSTWTGIYSYLLNPLLSKILIGINKIFGYSLSDQICRKLLKTQSSLPWAISIDSLKKLENHNIQVIYNAVGGSAINKLPAKYKNALDKNLSKASLVAVRDLVTKKNIESICPKEINISVIPDSAIVMSSLFSKEMLNTQLTSSEARKNLDFFEGNYVCFQSAYQWAKYSIKDIANQLEIFCLENNSALLLLPIGIVPGHNDQITARKILKALDKSIKVVMPTENRVFDIMAYIASSKCYAGTSLHGVITAISYSVPRVGLTQKVPKLEHFQKTWDLPTMPRSVEYIHLNTNLEAALKIPQPDMDRLRTKLISKYEDFFVKILNLM